MDIKDNQIVGFFGENGAGKSTLVDAMVGYRTIDKGTILFEGKSVQDSLEHIHRSVSYSTQAPLPLGFMKVYDILLTTARLRGKDKRAAIEQADLWLNRLGISAIKTSRLQNVSGGQHRLVGFATALMGDFTTLILDEPTNELDPEKRRLLWSSLVTLKKELGITIIVVTHDVDESEEFIDNAILFSHGQLVAQGTPAYFSEKSNNSHRMSSAKFSSRIVVLNHGEVDDMGSHRELMARRGLYQQLFSTQAQYYQE